MSSLTSSVPEQQYFKELSHFSSDGAFNWRIIMINMQRAGLYKTYNQILKLQLVRRGRFTATETCKHPEAHVRTACSIRYSSAE